jgi:transcriptional regulator with XRE-family HTH domain
MENLAKRINKGEWRNWTESVENSAEYAGEVAKIEFARAIERRMKSCDISRSELARRLGMSPAAVTLALRGDTNVSIERMARYAHALDSELHIHIAARHARVNWIELHNTQLQAQAVSGVGARTPQVTTASAQVGTIAIADSVANDSDQKSRTISWQIQELLCSAG